MTSYKKHFGIDISKSIFNITDSEGNYYQFENKVSGFKKFLKLLDSTNHCIMESTGYYHYQLAYFLVENNIPVSVKNPLSVKCFIQMKLSKIKTDKSDSKMICEYSQHITLKLWSEVSKIQQKCIKTTRLLDIYIKQSIMLKNKIHGDTILGSSNKDVLRSLKRSLKQLQKELKILEDKLLKKVKEAHQDLLTRIETILGIGRKTAVTLIILTDGFKRFNSGSELCRYSGLTPIIRQSGSSIKGRPRISEIGNVKLRNLLFMYSFNACKYNKA